MPVLGSTVCDVLFSNNIKKSSQAIFVSKSHRDKRTSRNQSTCAQQTLMRK
eukprot:m.206160 g.206160  ORF g.206160 m.206160 type:complete len:51 (+) comp16901_c0_seq9:728-880(+)